MTPDRAARVGDFLRAELAAIVYKEMQDPRVALLCVTDVRVRRDLSQADVYVSSLAAADADAREEMVRALNRAAGFLRRCVAARKGLRATPRFRFHYDDMVERGSHLLTLIDAAVGKGGGAAVAAETAHGP